LGVVNRDGWVSFTRGGIERERCSAGDEKLGYHGGEKTIEKAPDSLLDLKAIKGGTKEKGTGKVVGFAGPGGNKTNWRN